MPREVDTDLGELLALHSCNTQTTLDIYPAGEDPIHVATDAFTAEARDYSADLLEADSIQQTIAASTNRVKVVVDNVDKVFGGLLINGGLVKAEAVVGRFFRDEQTAKASPNTGEWAELFRGEVVPLELTEGEAILEIVHDLTAAGYVIANTTLAERCQWAYKHAGTCGYAGMETDCNKMRRSKFGCLGRSNEFRFGGMEFPEMQPPSAPQGPVIPPGGDGGGSPGNPGEFPTCPREDQYILCRGEDDGDFVLRRARHIRRNHYVWNPFGRFWDRVILAEDVLEQEIWFAETACGSRGESSGTHPLISGAEDLDGLAVERCKPGREQAVWSNGGLRASRLTAVGKLNIRATVKRIETEKGHIFAYGSSPWQMLIGHNSVKPVPGNES